VTKAPDDLEIDLMSGAFYAREPHDAYAWMRVARPGVLRRAQRPLGVASYAAVKAASLDTKSFSSAQGIRPKLPPLPMMIDFDAPEHVRRRRLVSEGFTPKRVRAMEDDLTAMVRRAHRQRQRRGELRPGTGHRRPLPIMVIGNLLGVAPTDRDTLLRWSDDMLKAWGPRIPR